MAVKSNDTAFSKSFGTVFPVILTDSSGNIFAASDSPNIYKKEVVGEVTTDFYLDYNGNEYQQPLNVGAFASSNTVVLSVKYFWLVDGQEVEKTPYAASVEAASADDELTTAYSPGEYVPKGTKHFIRVATTGDAGTYTVYAYAMSAKY